MSAFGSSKNAFAIWKATTPPSTRLASITATSIISCVTPRKPAPQPPARSADRTIGSFRRRTGFHRIPSRRTDGH
jgi:hypothetical protein